MVGRYSNKIPLLKNEGIFQNIEILEHRLGEVRYD